MGKFDISRFQREEYEYLHGNDGTPSQFQATILRPPHADELAVVGTIREQNPSLNLEHGISNFGYYRNDNDNDDYDDEIIPPIPPLPVAPPSTSSQHVNWIELRSPPPPPPATSTTVRSYPRDEYHYTQQPSPVRPTIDIRQYRDEYDDNDSDDFRFLSPIRRTDTSTDTYPGNYSTLVPKSILKGSSSTTPPLDTYPTTYTQIDRSRTSSKFDESPRVSVKINTDESIPMDYPTSAIEKTTPNQSILSSTVPDRVRYASVIQLNDIEWEVPREFQTVVYDLTNENLNRNNNNNNNNNNNYERLSSRQRTQSASTDPRTHVSRIFVPWDQEKRIVQPFYLSNNLDQNDPTQQQAFEY